MTRGAQQHPPGPGTATAGQGAAAATAGTTRPAAVRPAPAARDARARPQAAALARLALAAAMTALYATPAAAKPPTLPEGTISEVKTEGNVSVPNEKIRAKLLSKVGTPLDARTIVTDVKSLMNSNWFSDVKTSYEIDRRDPSGKSIVLIFIVREMPVLTSVEFRGLTKLKLKEVEETTELKKGKRADATRTHLAVAQIKRLYEEKGYELAEVKLVKGGNPGDTAVVIWIFEGPAHYVESIDFKGNVFASDGTLATKITSKTRMLNLFGGKYHRDNLDEDVRKIKEYYQGQGYFEVAVTPVTRTGADLGDIRIEFDISEGVRYTVRNISFEGNKKIPTETLREGLALHSGQPILDSVKEADRKNLVAKYQALGCIDTQILPDAKYTDSPGVIDLVYRIEEGEPYLLGNLIILGNERTKENVIRREAAMAGLLPGEPLDANRLETFKKRLSGTQYFVNSPDGNGGGGKPIEVKISPNRRPSTQPYADAASSELGVSPTARMQNADPEPAPALTVPRVEPLLGQGAGGLFGNGAGAAPGTGVTSAPSPASPLGTTDLFPPPADTPPIPVPIPNAPPAGPPAGPIGRPNRNAGPAQPPVGAGEPPGMIPSIPGLNANDVGPDRQDPFPARGYADVVTSLEEAPTGRLMFGVGASSFQGLTGQVTLYERNFDITNLPRSWNDLIGGNAFRGGGQEFRLELMPGTLINRFQVSLREPYLFNLPIGASSAGYLFQRIYPNWSEQRGGGRFSLGRQFGTQTYADMAFRIEDVNFYGYRTPAPADYLAASGHTTLATLRPSLRFDNRNAPLNPNKGQYLEFSFEEGWGNFTYPKAEVEGRTYFTLGSRPDGSGKRFVTMRGHFGATGRDTPVYERFYAGNFGSLRGFQYRGVGPHVLGVNVGGIMEALGSVEYQVPLSANDMFAGVVFTDFGTVESDYRFTQLRASVGAGLRITIPAFGPLPLCFDLAFPVAKATGDQVQVFNFTIGANY